MDTNTPAAETLTTAEVARLFSIRPNSVGTTLQRRGVEPLRREVGRRGQNIYDAAAVHAALPKLPAVTTATAPVFTPLPERASTITEVVVLHHCSGLPVMTWTRGEFSPRRVSAEFTNNHDGRGWEARVTVSGVRVLKSGTEGADDARVYFWPGKQEMPEWLTAWIADNTPAWEPCSEEVVGGGLSSVDVEQALAAAIDMGFVEVVPDDEAPAGYLRVVAPGEPGARMSTYDHPLNAGEEAEWRTAFAAGTPFVLQATDYGVDPGTALTVRLLDFRFDLLDFRIVVAEEGNGLVTGMVAIVQP